MDDGGRERRGKGFDLDEVKEECLGDVEGGGEEGTGEMGHEMVLCREEEGIRS